MHQKSSRLLRMTDGERPFTKDFADLFATLIVSLPLDSHRVRMSRVPHTFLSEEAINNLGSLKFSQSNRMPDPKDNARIVTTTTTTTFTMVKEMARSVCQRFLDSRFIETADGKLGREFTMRGTVWQLTPKGINILERFCARNGIQQKHVLDIIHSPRNTMQLVILERDVTTDVLTHDRSTLEVLFRRFIGPGGPNVKGTSSAADSDSLSEYKDGMKGVRMAQERKIGFPAVFVYETFTGKAAIDWLMDCSMVLNKREAMDLICSFIEQDFISEVQADSTYLEQNPSDTAFQPTKNAIYQMAAKGKDVHSMIGTRSITADESPLPARAGVTRDSNNQKLERILADPALRLLFREALRDMHCEENISFFLDVEEFLVACKVAIATATTDRTKGKMASSHMEGVKETMATAYGIYNAFLAPGSPCELNIDHLLRNQLATCMTKSVGHEQDMIDSLQEVTKLFEEAQLSVFKLMASDSVPKFVKSAKYEQTLNNFDLEGITISSSNSRSQSRIRTEAGSSNGTADKSPSGKD